MNVKLFPIGIGTLFVVVGCQVSPTYDPLVIPTPVVQLTADQLVGQATSGGPPATGRVGRGPVAGGGGPIEAGCSFTGEQIKGEEGDTFQVACPAGCEEKGWLFGTDVYTANSGICRSGIHAGAISREGGIVVVQLQPGRPAYRGSKRNRVTSDDTGAFGHSYAVILPAGQVAAAPPPPPPPQLIDAGCSFTPEQIRGGEVGTVHSVSCPAGCKEKGWLFGTDTYSGNSAVCRAAIHAGLISADGGTVVLIMDAAKPAFRGSLRNAVQSNDAGNHASSFHLKRP